MGTNGKKPIDQVIWDCINKGDFSGLDEAVKGATKDFLGGVEKTLHTVGDISTSGQPKSMSSYFGSYTKGSATDEMLKKINQDKTEKLRRSKEAEAHKNEIKKQQIKLNEKKELRIYVPFYKVGGVSSVVLSVAGGMGLAFSLVNLLRMFWHMIGGGFSLTSSVFGGAVCLFFFFMLNVGISKGKLLEKAKRFAFLCGQKQYIDINELSRLVNQSERKTVSDIKRMLKKGFFPEGHLDDDRKTLMLSDRVYGEYMKSLESRRLEDARKAAVDTTARVVEEDSRDPELVKLINIGNDYINRLHCLNDEIPGEVISQKLNRLEVLLKEIIVCVEKHPDQMSRMHEVMDYYIPTVIKLVEAYKEYDGITEAGDEILDAKSQIEGSIDKINDALKKILNNLFRDSVWDVTTDASVLNTMLAQKGLASPFKDKEDKNE